MRRGHIDINPKPEPELLSRNAEFAGMRNRNGRVLQHQAAASPPPAAAAITAAADHPERTKNINKSRQTSP